MATPQPERNDVRRTRRGRPHQRSIEQISFSRYIKHMVDSGQIDELQASWLSLEFRYELDRQRALEKRYRIIFWMVQTLSYGSVVLLPPLITASESIPWLRRVAVVVSFIVAATTVINQVYRPGPRWRIYRYTADTLSMQGTCFFQGLEDYEGVELPDRLKIFQVRTESILREFSRNYVVDVEAIIKGSLHERPRAETNDAGPSKDH